MNNSFPIALAKKDHLLLYALVLLACFLLALGLWLASEEMRFLILVSASVVVLGITFFVPNWSITIAFPLTWMLWWMNIDAIGGRPERLIVAIGIAGMTVMLAKVGKLTLGLTKVVVWGLVSFVFMFILSSLASPSYPKGIETIVSIVSRYLFLLLVMFHIRTEQDLKTALVVYIVASFIPSLLSLMLGLEYGFGFIRVYESTLVVRVAVNPLILNTSFSALFATTPGFFLLAFYPFVKKTWHKRIIMGAVVFLLAMAFVSQLRREIIITIPFILAIFAIDKYSGVQKIASRFLLALVIAFPLIIVPNFVTLQTRFHDENPQLAQGTDPRMMNFLAGYSAFAESPLIGTGPGSYSRTITPFLGYNQPSFLYNPYNVFIWAAVESGILSVIGLLILLYGVLREGLKWRQVADGFCGIVLRISPALIMQIFIWFSFGAAWELSLPWFLMGMILAAARITKEKQAGLVR